MNIFVTSDYSHETTSLFVESYMPNLTPNDVIMTTSREEDLIFVEYALTFGVMLKVYEASEFTSEQAFEVVSKEVDELLMFTDSMTSHYKHLYKHCSNQVLLEMNERITAETYKSLIEEMFQNKCEKLRRKNVIFNYHELYLNEVIKVFQNVKRVKITVKELSWYNV